jgi:MoaA/NifB/PqqE/SkfB family radical SAM enzyme
MDHPGNCQNLIIPDELRFAVTRKCDGSCRHCYNLSGKNTDKLTTDDFIRIIKEVCDVNPGMDRITLTGGEPLNEKARVLNISAYAKTLGIRIRLVTRGWELNTEICRELKEAGVTRLQIGLDSSGEFGYRENSKTIWDTFHSWLRGDKLGFKKTVGAIKMAVDEGLDVSIRYSLCRSNLNDVVPTYHFVSALGVSKFKFRILFPDGRAKRKLAHEFILGSEMANAQYDLILASKDNNTLVEITQPCMYHLPTWECLTKNGYLFNAHKETCPCGKVAAYVDSNGDVKYCLFDEVGLGNFCDTSFLAIWNSETVNKERAQRCPLDLTGTTCSSFKLLSQKHINYNSFMKSYQQTVNKNTDAMRHVRRNLIT